MSAPAIAIDARYIRTPLSGIGRYTRNLLGGLAMVQGRGPITVFVSPGMEFPDSIGASPNLKLVEVAGSPYRLADQLRLPAILRRHHVALLHTMDAFAPIAPTRARTVITIYDLIPLVCKKDMWRSKKAQFSFAWRKWLQTQCGLAAAIVTISQTSALDIHRELGVPQHSITVIPSGITQTTPISLARPINAAPYILYVGRRDPYKNIPRLIEAFAQAVQTVPQPLELIIVGAPDPRYVEPEAVAARLGVKDRVRFAGHVSDGELAALYAGAAAFVFPSLYEGQGLPPLEAMHAGVPVIASNRGAIPEAVGDAAILIDPLNVSEMAAALAKVLTDPVLAADLIRRGKIRAAQFTVQRQAQLTLDLYDRLLNTDAGARRA